MSRFIRSLALKLLPLSLLAMAGLAPALSSAATDPCATLESRFLEMHANGYLGVMGSENSGFNLTLDSTGTYHFNTWVRFGNEPWTSVVGTCKDRHIVFTRTGSHFVQTYDGWIFEVGGNEMAGTFTHNGVERYGWYAIMQLLPPR